MNMAKRDSTEKSRNSLAGKLLIAMPSINDPRFEKAVIFMCAHDEKGAMGLMVNSNLSDIAFDKVIEQTGLKSDISVDIDKIKVMNGGPVEVSRGFLLHSGEFEQKETIHISREYGVTGTVEALEDVVSGNGPERMLFVLGHAGWGAGQLDREMQQNSWLVVDATPEIVFAAPIERKWELALAALGIDPMMLSGQAGNA